MNTIDNGKYKELFELLDKLDNVIEELCEPSPTTTSSCMFDLVIREDRKNGFAGTRTLGLSCSCPKCATWC